MQPLDGITVLDFSTLLPGPMASLLLAEAGADVIKIERPGTGDEMRGYAPFLKGQGIFFALLNRGKQSLALDLKSPADLARLQPYLERADILIEQFRPGVMARFGLDHATLAQRFPRLIYCAITGYGQTGPKAGVAGHDLNYIAETGLLALSMGSPEAPVVPPALIADIAGGAYPAVTNILLALQARQRTGQGALLDISMTDNLFPLMWWALGQRAATGAAPGNADSLLTGGTARYRLYTTQDRQVVAVAAIEQRFWDTLCEVVGLDAALRDDARDPAATIAAVARIFAGRPAAHWQARFAGVDCCACLVADLDQALASSHFRARGVAAYSAGIGAAAIPALPVPIASTFRGDFATAAAAAPALGSLDDP